MRSVNRGGLEWDLVVAVLSEYDRDGFIGIGLDHYGEQEAGVPPAELHSPHGFYSRPRDPDTDGQGNPTKGCNVWLAWEGNTPHALLASDPRVIDKLPKLAKGGSIFYADTGKGQLPAWSFDGTTGTATLYVPYAFDSKGETPSKAHTISVSVDNDGAECIQIVAGSGATVSLLFDGSVNVVAGDLGASVSVTSGGKIVLNGNTTLNGGMVCGSPTAAQSLAMAPGVIAYLGALQTALAAFCVACEASSTEPALKPAATALATAVGALSALVAPINSTLVKGL